MATKANLPERSKAKTTNPIGHVAYQAGDLSGVETTGRGGKELVPVTSDLREFLQAGVARAAMEIASETAIHPDLPSVLVIRLRDIAIAKSHRPTELAIEAGMPPAGHGHMDEMLVAANAVSLSQLNKVIAERNTKTIRANLSAVEGFETWGVQRRLPKNFRGKRLTEVRNELIALNRRLMLRLFSHRSEAMTELVFERMVAMLLQLKISYVFLPQRIGPPLFLVDMNGALTDAAFEKLLHFQGLRHLSPEPHVLPIAAISAAIQAPTTQFTSQAPGNDLPIIGIFDTGVDPRTAAIAPWVASRETFVLPPETDYLHGTSVGSLVVDSYGLNGSNPLFPSTPCRIHDVCALETGGSRISDLLVRLRDAVRNRPEVKVWNLSLGAEEIGDEEFSIFARELDSLSDVHGVLFVVAAGNYLTLPRRGWPAGTAVLADRISSPGDSVRAITVGSLAHLDGATSLVKAGEPAPYSRRGPGPVFTPKPDIVHLGGNGDVNFASPDIGLNVLAPGGAVYASCGTSFAAPIAASMAAHAWQALDIPGRVQPLNVTANLVKALMIHSAQLNSPDRSASDKRYFGAGLPADPTSILYDSDSSFTLLFELNIADTTKWRKAPFPVPPSLMKDGKLSCEIIMTAAYAPALNAAAGAEYVRVNVDVGFGILTTNAEGKIRFAGQVPAEGELGTTGFEEAQIEHGGKWSPVKTYRRVFPKGKAADVWALQATITRRAFEPPLAQPLRVVIVITLRAIDGNPHVYGDGQRALLETNWLTQNIVNSIPIQVQT